MNSTDEDIAEIERAARAGADLIISPPQTDSNSLSSNYNAPKESANQGKTITSADTYNSSNMSGDLLVNFPGHGASPSTFYKSMYGHDAAMVSMSSFSSSSSGKAKQRNSVSLNPLAMKGALTGLVDLVDSDSDDENDKPARKGQSFSPPRAVSNPKASGGPDHRPLVGGFAAAAYEAARVDYYRKQGKEVRGHIAPTPRSYYPHYP